MNGRLLLVLTITGAITLALPAFAAWLLLDTPGVLSILALGPVWFLSGVAGFALMSYWTQMRRTSSALSLAVNCRSITRNLYIGSIARTLLSQASEASPGAGPRYVEGMEKLAVFHGDRIRLGFETTVDMTRMSLDPQGWPAHRENGRIANGSLSIAVDTDHFVLRRGEPYDPVAIIDGKERILTIRHQLPEAVRQSMIDKARQGPFRLDSLIDVEALGEDRIVEAVHMLPNEVHVHLRSDMVPWSEVRDILDPEYRKNHILPRRLLAVVRSAWKNHF